MTAPVTPPLVRTARPLPADATEVGLAFHRLVFARRRSGWWTPLVVGLLGLAIYAGFLAMGAVAGVVVALVNPDVATTMLATTEDAAFDLTQPVMTAVLLLTIVLMLPAYLLASLIVNGRRTGLISSVAGRLRWGWMLVCGVAAIVVAVVVTLLSMLLPAELAGENTTAVLQPADNPQLWASLAVILLVIPLQAAAEEYVFRGFLMQSIGRWLRHPLFAILLPVPLFVLGHLYDPLGQASVAVFAIAAGWMTWRTGGLEAAISLHVVNNLTAFLTALAGFTDINATSPGVGSLIFSVVLIGGYVGLIEWMQRRARLRRTLVLTPAVQPDPPYAAATESASRIV